MPALNMKYPLEALVLSAWSPIHVVILGGSVNCKVRSGWRKCHSSRGLSRACLVLAPSCSASRPPLHGQGPLPS